MWSFVQRWNSSYGRKEDREATGHPLDRKTVQSVTILCPLVSRTLAKLVWNVKLIIKVDGDVVSQRFMLFLGFYNRARNERVLLMMTLL